MLTTDPGVWNPNYLWNTLFITRSCRGKLRKTVDWAICGYMQFHVPFIVLSKINTAILNCTDNYDVKQTNKQTNFFI